MSQYITGEWGGGGVYFSECLVRMRGSVLQTLLRFQTKIYKFPVPILREDMADSLRTNLPCCLSLFLIFAESVSKIYLKQTINNNTDFKKALLAKYDRGIFDSARLSRIIVFYYSTH